ncbi:hypothetical protein PSTG_14901 [Puccinia striiformis f. sp. tritici PST-78]|uniref:Transcriptional coactivator hfi1/ADA1 n=1 Tax=Puccinia striiformis f. sp. tritici PST-78 TaxID=1165861 RepID=A0A0L0UXM2_9BASI|nr:hypothetical protein PSTG_14901 [Puccinia striiformis f. sp. tritici PST-78]
MLDQLTGAVPAELYPPKPTKRADTLAIKQAIAEALSEQDGLTYWTSLVKFIKGNLDPTEFHAQTAALLKSERLVGLHNALVLSILYNTTCLGPSTPNPDKESEGPTTTTTTTGEGWHKRKRVTISASPTPPTKPKPKSQEKDPKKRRLKQAVMALGQRERNRLKQIASLKDELKLNSQKSLLSSPYYLHPERTPNVMDTPLASKMKISSSTLYQDYMRCQQAPICSESKQLPNFETLKDRMSLIAYDSGLANGVDKTASSIALIALEVHLKTLLGDLLSLIRSDRSVANPVETGDPSSTTMATDDQGTHTMEQATSIDAPIDSSSSSSARPDSSPSTNLTRPDTVSTSPTKASGTIVGSASQTFHQASSDLRLRDLKTQGLAPHLTSRDVAALAEISPHAFVRTHPPALERLIAVCNSTSTSSATALISTSLPENIPDRIGLNNDINTSNLVVDNL